MINLKDYMFYMIDFEYANRERNDLLYADSTVSEAFNVIARSEDEARAIVIRRFASYRGFKITQISEVYLHAILYSIE